MEKKFYVVLFSALCISLLLLGFSFSKESGSNDIANMAEINKNDFRVVYSNNQRLDTKDNNQVDISIINKSNDKMSFSLYLNEVNEKKYTDVYYVLNDGEEQQLNNNIINLGEVNAYGEEEDHVSFNVKIYSKSEANLNFKLEVKSVDSRLLTNKIIASHEVYQDISENIRYFGENVNNYLKYDNAVYRIVGLIDDKIEIISEPIEQNIYNPTNNDYLTVENYIRSFSSNSGILLEEIVGQKSWLLTNQEYWLLESDGETASHTSEASGIASSPKSTNYYVRKVFKLDSNLLVTAGDGTEIAPYEVSYGS